MTLDDGRNPFSYRNWIKFPLLSDGCSEVSYVGCRFLFPQERRTTGTCLRCPGRNYGSRVSCIQPIWLSVVKLVEFKIGKWKERAVIAWEQHRLMDDKSPCEVGLVPCILCHGSCSGKSSYRKSGMRLCDRIHVMDNNHTAIYRNLPRCEKEKKKKTKYREATETSRFRRRTLD